VRAAAAYNFEDFVNAPREPVDFHEAARPSTAATEDTALAVGRKRLEKFAALMSRFFVTDDADTIHDVRVWSRRLQQVLAMRVSESNTKSKAQKLARKLRAVRKILGRPRNLDVIHQLVQERIDGAQNPVVRDGWEQLRNYLTAPACYRRKPRKIARF
jgi:CHAD domain-containing protein